VGELSNLLNLTCCSGESGKDSTNVSSLLHGNDSELIFFIYPDKESLFVVVEYASALRPVSVQATRIQESVTFLEKEVIRN